MYEYLYRMCNYVCVRGSLPVCIHTFIWIPPEAMNAYINGCNKLLSCNKWYAI